MATILETLYNARYNFEQSKRMPAVFGPLAAEQLNNAITLLENGYPLHTEVETILDQYEDLDSIPYYQDPEQTT